MAVTHIFKFLFIVAFGVSLHLFLVEGIDSGIQLPHFDKVAHFTVFAGLSLLFDLGFNKKTVFALALAFIYGVTQITRHKKNPLMRGFSYYIFSTSHLVKQSFCTISSLASIGQ